MRMTKFFAESVTDIVAEEVHSPVDYVEIREDLIPNETATWYLEKELGPQSQELYKAVPITVIYAAIFVTGIVGNVATCVVIARNRYMQTATNCYLFNLAVSDLLMLVSGLPQVSISLPTQQAFKKTILPLSYLLNINIQFRSHL